MTPGVRASVAGPTIAASLQGKFAPRELLESVLARAATALGGTCGKSTEELPEVLGKFVDKVVSESFKVIDRDFENLRAAGYSDDAIIDISLAASSGAAMARLQRGLAALDKEI